jgi:hypothetical protein
MNPRPSNNTSSTAYDARIDAALRVYGGATPVRDLESRIAARIAATPRQSYRSTSSGFMDGGWLVLLRGVSVGALAAAAACAIVVGTVRHSQRIAVPQAAGASRSDGISAAGATHVPTRAIPPSATIDPQSPRSAPHSRATVSRSAGNKPVGSAVPRSPYPPDQPPSDPQQ